MSELPGRARVVVIGAGIAGNAVVHHLAELGWDDIVQIDKGPLPNPGGSTGHSSSMISWLEPAPAVAAVTAESDRFYTELGVLTRSGGLEVARTPQRMADLLRRDALARSRGFRAELLTPAQVLEHFPFADTSLVLGGFYTEATGVLDAVLAGTTIRERAIAAGKAAVFPRTEVSAIDVVDGRVTGVRTDRGDVSSDIVVLCGGVWSPRLARMAGTSIPMTPGVLQQVSIGPIAAFADVRGEIAYPIFRDMDVKMFMRQHGADIEVGSYDHPAILVEADDIPSIEASVFSPTELPFTQEHFDGALEKALEILPEIFGDERAGIRHAFNGLVSLSADNLPIIGELEGVRGLWSANRVDVKVAPAIARLTAEWIVRGKSDLYGHPFDIDRFDGPERAESYVKARSAERFERQYEIIHPLEEWYTVRDARLSPMHPRQVDLGAVFAEASGWEIPKWYAANERLVGEYADRLRPRTAEWESRYWSPIIDAEHLAMREAVAISDISANGVIDLVGPAALATAERLVTAPLDGPDGLVVDTWMLDPGGAVVSEATVIRLGRDHVRFVTAPGRHHRDRTWIGDHLGEATSLLDEAAAWCGVRLLGSSADAVAEAVGLLRPSGDRDEMRRVEVGPVPGLAGRRMILGDPGWEIHARTEVGLALWDRLWEAGRDLGLIAVGTGVTRNTARLEAGRPAVGTEFSAGRGLVEARIVGSRPGADGADIKASDFIGRDALLARLDRGPTAMLVTLALDDDASSIGERRSLMGGEPLFDAAGEPLVDASGRQSLVTSAGNGPSLGRQLLMAFVPPAVAAVGTRLLAEYFGDRYPMSVVAVGAGVERLRVPATIR